MISFRFHVVSITAVFLGIAIGIVVGTTYVDGAVVDGLRNQIERVSGNLDARKQENDRLDAELGAAREYIDTSAAFAVTDRLADDPTLVLAIRGIDEGAVNEIALLVRAAGAVSPGVVWVEDRWELEGDDDRADLAEVLGMSPDDEVEELWEAGWSAVAEALTEAPAPEGDSPTPPLDGSTTTTLPADEAPGAVLDALVTSGFLSVDSLDDASTSLADLAGERPRVLVITGARAREAVAPMLPFLVAAPLAAELPTVVADVYVDAPEAPERAEALTQLLSEEVRGSIAIVDHGDLPEGQVAAILALDAVSRDTGGHYGLGGGADGVLPGWTPP